MRLVHEDILNFITKNLRIKVTNKLQWGNLSDLILVLAKIIQKVISNFYMSLCCKSHSQSAYILSQSLHRGRCCRSVCQPVASRGPTLHPMNRIRPLVYYYFWCSRLRPFVPKMPYKPLSSSSLSLASISYCRNSSESTFLHEVPALCSLSNHSKNTSGPILQNDCRFSATM